MTQVTEKAVLAGGCFWGMQDLVRKMPGVISTRVGYTGGTVPNATYSSVKTGRTGHAEALEVIFNPDEFSFRKLLEFFFQIHDPTTADRQGGDRGSQYRSAIFYTNAEQLAEARRTITDVDASGIWPGKVVTEVVPFSELWEAEDVHQDYLERHPNGYSCHFARKDWVLPQVAE